MGTKKELFILRHGKSSWEVEDISDIDRPLKVRGVRNSYEMARRLKIDRHIPEFYISSPANRALHTATIFLNVFELSYQFLSIDERLYGHGVPDIIDAIKEQDNSISRLMIFGHNPDLSELARTFAKNITFELPTCGLAIFAFDCKKWSEISQKLQVKEFFDFPNKED